MTPAEMEAAIQALRAQNAEQALAISNLRTALEMATNDLERIYRWYEGLKSQVNGLESAKVQPYAVSGRHGSWRI